MSPTEEQAARVFVVHAAQALHGLGTPAHGLEAAVREIGKAVGLEVTVSATPTTMWLGFGPVEDQRVVLLRVHGGDVDLGRLVEVDELIQDVARGACDAATADRRLAAILAAPRRWPPAAAVLAGGVQSAGAAVLFGGQVADLALASVLGACVVLAGQLARGRTELERALPTLAAFAATAIPRLVTDWGVHPAVVGLSSILVFLPGLSFTMALVELSTGNLVAGVARLAGAGVTLLRLILGVAVAQVLVVTGPVATEPGTATWALPLALVLSPLAFGISLGARARDLPLVWVASAAAWGGAVLGADTLGPEAGAGVGAFLLGVLGNGWANRRLRPSTVPLTVGILLLVPGSFGFRSLAAMLEGDVLLGVEQAFRMAMIATSLAAGLLLASTVVPPRRAL